MERSETLRRTMLEFYVALNTHDEAAVKERHDSSADALSIGTGDEWIEGGDAIVATFAAQFRDYPDLVFEPGDVVAYQEGTVGWVHDRPTVQLGDGTTIPARATGVAHLVDGDWRIVQTHLSVAAAAG